ncbi:MAG: hypothetical protein CEE43_01715 [Promethearchaeota archaeon Loki_b32]|nr:MAG: hypothetical protein CEE43_01715 [Candidatus Lokiarchaeota archaeon Loki_b32]
MIFLCDIKLKNYRNLELNLELFQKEFRKRNNTYERIVEWKKIAEEESNEIKKFIFRWISFNGLYTASYAMDHSQEEAERENEIRLIESFCYKFILTNKNLASKIYSKELKEVFENNIKEKSRSMGRYLEHLKCNESVEVKAKNMILIAYKIRCRLFHGEKNPLLEVNQAVIKAANQVIAPILNHIAKENK